MRSVPRYTTNHSGQRTEETSSFLSHDGKIKSISPIHHGGTSLCTRNVVQTGRRQGWTDRHGRVRHVKWQGSRAKKGGEGAFLTWSRSRTWSGKAGIPEMPLPNASTREKPPAWAYDSRPNWSLWLSLCLSLVPRCTPLPAW